ncbi:MAG: T9SS type A sorting domain-containing protein [Flavobacteriaceae bacterium]|nr:T9SS type A sorting domain-containing protein [Flavobacteriaceae bacterium]
MKKRLLLWLCFLTISATSISYNGSAHWIENVTTPDAVCTDITVYLDTNGMASIVASDVDGGSSDPDGIASLSIDISNFDCSTIGTNSVTLTVTDVLGNSATCTATVTVEDIIGPTFNIAGPPAGLPAPPTSILSTVTEAQFFGILYDLDIPSPAGFSTGIPYITDNSGVTGIDPDRIAYYMELDGEWVWASMSDFTGGDLVAMGVPNSTSNPARYANIVSDMNINTNSPNITPAMGINTGNVEIWYRNYSTNADQNIGGSGTNYDLDDRFSNSGSYGSFQVHNHGAGETLFALNRFNSTSGNVDIGIGNSPAGNPDYTSEQNGASFTDRRLLILVSDPIVPEITIPLDATGFASISITDFTVSASDNCGTATLSLSQTAFTCSDLGANQIKISATDDYGNSTTIDAIVNVEDITPPAITCPADITVSNDPGSCDAYVTVPVPTITDECITHEAAMNFDGSNDYMLSYIDATSTDFTMEAWFKANSSVGGFRTIICWQKTGRNHETSLAVANTGVLRLGQFDYQPPTRFQEIIGTTNVRDDQWHHVAAVKSGDDWTLYLDGVAEGTLTLHPNNSSFSGLTDLRVGNIQFNGGGRGEHFNGEIDEVRIWDIPLTQAQIQTNMNVSLTGNETGLKTLFNFNEGIACADNSGFTTINDKVSGAVGTLFNFDGLDGSLGCDSNFTDTLLPPIVITNDNNNTEDASGTYPVGTTTVAWTITDLNGNSSVCSVNVTVEDTELPVAACQDFTAQLDATGTASVSATDVDNGSTDNCGIASTTLDIISFDCSDIGANTITMSVTDPSGNISTCTSIITVEDNIAPTALCQDITVQLDATGSVSISDSDIDNGSYDNCSFTSTITPNTFSCANIGVNTVTYTLTDSSGNSTTCNALVTVEDTVAPATICQDITIQLDSSGMASITATEVDGGSTDACGIASSTIDILDFDCDDIGINTITLTITDVNGNTSSCIAQVTVEDTMVPTASCQDITIPLDASGSATITPADIDGGSSDNCSFNGSVTPNTFSCTDIGPNTVTYMLTDGSGNTSSCSAIVTVVDNIFPTATCQDLIIQLDSNGMASISVNDIDNGSFDNCSIANANIDITNFNCADIGSNAVTLTVTDPSGNTSTCVASVTVEDPIAPNIICQDITVQLDATGIATITAGDIDGGSTDACGIVSTSIDITEFDCNDIGTNPVTLTVVDTNGNISNCVALVTVEDTIAPSTICQDITIQLDTDGMASITVDDIDNGSTDACGIVSTSIDIMDFDCTDVGTNTVTLTVTDIHGNTSTCSATVTVEDTNTTTAICQDITIQLDTNGMASIVADDVDGGSVAACSSANLAIDITDFTCANVGDNTVTLTVTDVNGNTSTCTALVTVEDTIAPTILCQDITVQLDETGIANIAATDIDNGSTDACGIANTTIDITNFDCNDLGENTVTLTATDINGNIASCQATVTVEDRIAPTVQCQDITVQLDENGMVSITADLIDNASSDACGIANRSIDLSNFDCSNLGANSVELTITDANGNLASCYATVWVEDTIAPIVNCENLVIELDANGMATIDPSDLESEISDACGIATMTLDKSTFDCADLGENNIALTVSDDSGNTTTCTAIVTIVDTIAPIINCSNVTVPLNAEGYATITPEYLASISDNCGIASTSLDIFEFDCSDVGVPISVQIFAEDINGNTATCSAQISVVDNLPPVLSCPSDPVVELPPGVSVYELPDYVGIGMFSAQDNCSDSVRTLGQYPAPGTPLTEGVHIVSIVTIDNNGEFDRCLFELTLINTTIEEDMPNILGSLVLYPNPTNDRFFLSNELSLQLDDLRIYDITGRLVKEVPLNGTGILTPIDVTELASATYLIVISAGDDQFTRQLIKE